MKPNLRRGHGSLALLALLLALVPALTSCASMAQRGALGRAYKAYDRHDYGTALRHISRSEAYHAEMTVPQRAEACYLKGRCLEGLNNPLEAISLYEYLIRTFPGTEHAARAEGRIAELRKSS